MTSEGLMVTHGSMHHLKNKYKYVTLDRGKNTALKDIKEHEVTKNKLERDLQAEKTALKAEGILQKEEEIAKLEIMKEELKQKLESAKHFLENKKKIRPPVNLVQEMKDL